MPNRAITLHKPTVHASVGVAFEQNIGSTTTFIGKVAPGSLSADAGLQPGMKVLSIKGISVTSPSQGTGLIKEATGAIQIIVQEAASGATSSTAQVVPGSSIASDPHCVVFNRNAAEAECGCDAQVEKPLFDSWFRGQGVSEADFNDMMDKIVAPINAYQKSVPAYITLTLVSCGLAGWCCQIAEGAALAGKIQAVLDEFHAKYPSVRGSMTQVPPGLSFVGTAPAAAAVVVAAAPVVMQRDDQEVGTMKKSPEETLTQLKSLHDKGLITDDEYAAKRAELLASM